MQSDPAPSFLAVLKSRLQSGLSCVHCPMNHCMFSQGVLEIYHLKQLMNAQINWKYNLQENNQNNLLSSDEKVLHIFAFVSAFYFAFNLMTLRWCGQRDIGKYVSHRSLLQNISRGIILCIKAQPVSHPAQTLNNVPLERAEGESSFMTLLIYSVPAVKNYTQTDNKNNCLNHITASCY